MSSAEDTHEALEAKMHPPAPRRVGETELPDGRSLGWAEFGHPDGDPLLWYHGTPGARTQIPPAADEAGLKRGIRELGFPVDADHFDYQEFVAKFHPDYYTDDVDEGGAALHSANIVTEQLRELFSRRSTNYHNVQIPPDLILGLRAFYGTLFVLSRLRVGIDPSRPSFRRAVEAAVLSAEAMATPPP